MTNNSLLVTLVDFIQAVPEHPYCIHGDLQIGNIIRSGSRDLWIDVGQFSYGVPEWDLGFTWRVTGITREERSQELFHLSPARLPYMIFFALHKPINEQIARKFVAPAFDGENVW